VQELVGCRHAHGEPAARADILHQFGSVESVAFVSILEFDRIRSKIRKVAREPGLMAARCVTLSGPGLPAAVLRMQLRHRTTNHKNILGCWRSGGEFKRFSTVTQ